MLCYQTNTQVVSQKASLDCHSYCSSRWNYIVFMCTCLQDNRHYEHVDYNLLVFKGKYALLECLFPVKFSVRSLDLSDDKLQGSSTAISKYKS